MDQSDDVSVILIGPCGIGAVLSNLQSTVPSAISICMYACTLPSINNLDGKVYN